VKGVKRGLKGAALAMGLVVGTLPATSWSADLNKLINQLKSKSANEQIQAADDLADLGAGAATAAPALTSLLASDNPLVRWHAARTLGALGPKAESAVPALQKALGDEDATVRAHAARALGEVGKAALPAVPALVGCVTDEDLRVRRAAIGALRDIRPGPDVVLPLFSKLLSETDPALVTPALHTLAELGGDAVPVLLEALDRPDGRYWACLVLGEIGEPAAPAVDKLTEVLQDKEPHVQLQAAMALAGIGPKAASAAGSLAKIAEDEKQPLGVRYAAAYALGKTGSPEGIETFTRGLDSPDKLLRVVNAWGLLSHQPKDSEASKKASDILVDALSDEDSQVQSAAAHAAAELPQPVPGATERLAENLKDTDPAVIESMINALAGQGERVVPRVIRGLKDPELRGVAVAILGRMGPAASSAVSALNESLTADDPVFRTQVCYTLGRLGPAAAAAVPMLTKSLASRDAQERSAAAFALGSIGTEAKTALPALQKGLRDPDEFVQLANAWAIIRIAPADAGLKKAALPRLLKSLEEEDDQIRMDIVKAIGDLGAATGEVRAALEKVKAHASRELAKLIDEVLAKRPAKSTK
jgi:HEAT repeat protein